MALCLTAETIFERAKKLVADLDSDGIDIDVQCVLLGAAYLLALHRLPNQQRAEELGEHLAAMYAVIRTPPGQPR
jgi:hypothetical protein